MDLLIIMNFVVWKNQNFQIIKKDKNIKLSRLLLMISFIILIKNNRQILHLMILRGEHYSLSLSIIFIKISKGRFQFH
jgi:hypothetical protein